MTLAAKQGSATTCIAEAADSRTAIVTYFLRTRPVVSAC